MSEEFKIPDFILEQNVDAVHERMQAIMPDDIDVSLGSPVYDQQRSVALEIARFSEYILVETIKQAFPQYANDEFLNYHAGGNGLVRKAATAATGTVTVTGKAGTEIPEGFIFSTASATDVPSVDFKTIAAAIIPESGTIDIPVECTEPGTNGNVGIDTIILRSSSMSNTITGVTNAAPTTGGTDEEDDEALRERVVFVEQTKGISFVGSKSDYKRWAEEVDGVGEAIVISAQDDSGTVTIILIDAEGSPASETLCTAVYDYIMGVSEEDINRKANLNATLVVIPPTIVTFTIAATVERDVLIPLEDIKKEYIKVLNEYLITAPEDGEVKYSKVYSLLSKLEGVNDFSSVTLNGSTANVAIEKHQLAIVTDASVTLSDGVVE